MKGVPRPRSRGSHVTLAVWQSHTLILYSELASAAQRSKWARPHTTWYEQLSRRSERQACDARDEILLIRHAVGSHTENADARIKRAPWSVNP